VIAAALGVLTWTLLEYLMHRWLGHRFRRNPFGREHVRHHVEGNYFAPTWKKLIFAAAIATALGLLAGIAFAAGLIGAYAAYEVLHRLEHTHAGIGPYGRWARRHHFHHHFVDGRTNHGVTSPIWDFVFGTYQAPSTIRVPRKLCMPWLVDPATGEIRAAYAHTYQLR
jgi:sterol desaturase/sphingolipid hydroxylase (fatty acid hydroxylase superfamily)